MDDASYYEEQLYENALKEKLRQLKQERLDSNTYQSVFSETSAMDYGPEFELMSDDLINNMYDKNKKLDRKIKNIENELEELR